MADAADRTAGGPSDASRAPGGAGASGELDVPESPDALDAASRESVVVFRLAGERFGVPTGRVERVVDDVRVARLTGFPEHIAGVVRHRERWLPAVDAAPALGLPARSEPGAALIVRRGRLRYALAADAVLATRAVSVEETAAGASAPDGATIAGRPVLDDDGALVTLFDPDELFAAAAPAEGEDAMTVTESTGAPRPVVAFRVGDGEFGLDVSQVHEVLPYEDPQKVPDASDFIEGVVGVRGSILPVMDLRRQFELEPADGDEETRILVVSIAGERVGMIVDAVRDVVRLPPEAVAPPPAYLRELAQDYVDGLARGEEQLLVLIRTDRLLTEEQRDAVAGAGAAADVEGAEHGDAAGPDADGDAERAGEEAGGEGDAASEG